MDRLLFQPTSGAPNLTGLLSVARQARVIAPVSHTQLLDNGVNSVRIRLHVADQRLQNQLRQRRLHRQQRACVLYMPHTVPGQRVSVGFDGWVFPRSGVAFVWAMTTRPASTLPSL